MRNGNDQIKLYNNRLDELISFFMIMKWFNRNKYILENIHIYTNHYCKYLDQTLFWSWLGYNPDHKKMTYRSDWCIKLNKGVYSCESGLKNWFDMSDIITIGR